jgi:hypothetical protein
LDETPGTLRKLWHAMGCRWGAIKVGDVLRQQKWQLDERTREFSRWLMALIGEAGLEGALRAGMDAAADVEGRRPDHESIVARVVEDYIRHARESSIRRRFRRWRIFAGWTLKAVFNSHRGSQSGF